MAMIRPRMRSLWTIAGPPPVPLVHEWIHQSREGGPIAVDVLVSRAIAEYPEDAPYLIQVIRDFARP